MNKMKQWVVICVLASAGSMLGGGAWAQDLGKLADAAAADKLAIPAIEADMKGKVSDNERFKKEYDIYADQLKTRVGPKISAYEVKNKSHNQHADKVNAAVAKYNSVCHGTLPKPTYERCQGEKPQLQRMINEVNSRKSVLDAEKASLTAERAKYVTAMDGLSAKMKANFAAWEQQKSRLDKLRANIAATQTAMLGRCKNASQSERSSPQFLKYCSSFGFDNPNQNLKPLDENAAKKGMLVTPNSK